MIGARKKPKQPPIKRKIRNNYGGEDRLKTRLKNRRTVTHTGGSKNTKGAQPQAVRRAPIPQRGE